VRDEALGRQLRTPEIAAGQSCARDAELSRRAFRLRGATVECLNFKFEHTPEGRLVETIFAAQGELEREQNRRQVLQKMQARAMLGYWVFQAPIGYGIEKVAGHGKLLVREEPLASIAQEALDSYASGRLATHGEIKRFLESQPAWPKDPKGEVHWERMNMLLTQTLYAGRIDSPRWKIHHVPARPEPWVSLETWRAVQDRRSGAAKPPARKDIRDDFALRGASRAHSADKLSTACWSKGRSRHHTYDL
jgi:hypothetical protein